MGYQDRITIEPGEDQILRDFPDLAREDIRACLAFAADRERKLVSVPPQ